MQRFTFYPYFQNNNSCFSKFTSLLTIMCLLFIGNSCKDNLEPSPTTTPVESKISIEEAKKWFNQAQSFGNAGARTSGQGIERETLWDFARHVKSKKNREGVLIPLRF